MRCLQDLWRYRARPRSGPGTSLRHPKFGLGREQVSRVTSGEQKFQFIQAAPPTRPRLDPLTLRLTQRGTACRVTWSRFFDACPVRMTGWLVLLGFTFVLFSGKGIQRNPLLAIKPIMQRGARSAGEPAGHGGQVRCSGAVSPLPQKGRLSGYIKPVRAPLILHHHWPSTARACICGYTQ